MSRWFNEQICQWVLLLALVARQCCGHVVLTYPPARTYPLDFLNNIVTPAPCGMPRDPSLVHYTDLQAGSSLQVFWDIPYPHRGGMFLELLNHNNDVMQRYPQDGEALANDASQQNYTVQLPAATCVNCTLRIVTRGLEWGDNLLFWSCSDVNLLASPVIDRQKCSNHGLHDGNRCLCDRKYDGHICQFQNDCVDESDCNNHGQCVDTESTKYPRHRCFCSAGWFGRFCERESPVRSRAEIHLLDYTQHKLTNNYTLYHRILADSQELEVVLVAKSVTWIAVGWRPKDANKTCLEFPVLNFRNGNVSMDISTTGNTLVTERPGTTPGTTLMTEGPGTTPGTTLVTEGPGTTPGTTLVTEGPGTTHGSTLVTEGPGTTHGSTLVTEGSGTTPGSTLETEGPRSNQCGGSCDVNSGCVYSVIWTQDPTSRTVTFTISVQLLSDEYFGLGFSRDNAMPDSDIVVGWVRSNGSIALSDQWAASRTLPKEDTHNDLTLISSQVVDKMTDVTFSRAADTQDSEDQKLDISECIYLLTARGKTSSGDSFVYHSERKPSSEKFCFNKCHGSLASEPVAEPNKMDNFSITSSSNTTNSVSSTTKGISSTTNSVSSTTNSVPSTTNSTPDTTNSTPDTTNSTPDTTNSTPDTTNSTPNTKNHVPEGDRNTSTGSELTANSCDGSCTLPSHCLFNVSWIYDPAMDKVHFSVAVQLESNQYFGLGFSEDQLMPDSDMVIGWVKPDGGTYLSDRWATGHRQPEEDLRQDLTQISGQIVSGMTSVMFSRSVLTSDSQDLPLNLIGCIYLLTAKGTRNDDNSFMYHSEKRSSPDKFCFNKCQGTSMSELARTDTVASNIGTSLASNTTSPVSDMTSHASETTTSVPGTTSSVPGTTISVSGTTSSVPGTTSSVPGTTSSVSGTTSSVPGTTSSVPGTTSSVSGTTSSVPGTTSSVPGTTSSVSGTTSSVPGTKSLADNTTTPNLNATSRVTDTTNRVSDTTSSVPDATSLVSNADRTTDPRSQLTPSSCDGSCSWPSDCLYNVSWTYEPLTDRVHFSIAVQLDVDQYFGLGFSQDQLMADSDIIIGWVRSSGSTYLSDRWATGRVNPSEDSNNDLTVISGEVVNGITMVVFSRLLDTQDAMDQALNVEACIHLLTSVGSKRDEDNSFSQHARRIASGSKYCFSNCLRRPTEARGDTGRRKRASEGDATPGEGSKSQESLQPMDCTDLIIGSARGSLSSIGDYYTHDRSTPLHDEVYGGSDSLTAALGFEENEFTTILFRKKLQSTERTDWSIETRVMHVIWARGQQSGEIYHSPESAYERNEMSDRNFYKPDVLKYHGGSTNNRGVTILNFYVVDGQATSSPPPPATGFSSTPSTRSGTDDSLAPGSATSRSVTNESPHVTVIVPSSIKLLDASYNSQLSDLQSQVAQQTKAPIEHELNRKLTGMVMGFKNVEVTRFSPGSVVVDFDVRVDTQDGAMEQVQRNVEIAMVSVVESGSLSGHTLDKNHLVIGEPRTEQVSSDDGRSQGLGEAEIIVIVVIIIVVCLVAAGVVGYKIWTRRKAKSNMNQARNGNASYAGNIRSQSHSEMQESSRNSKEDGRRNNKEEGRPSRGHDNSGFDSTQERYHTYVA